MKEQSVGGIVLNNGKVVVVSQKGTSWSLPKGHVNENEKISDALYREIYEETGLRKGDLKLIKKLGFYNRPDGVTGNPKDIHMSLFITDKTELVPIDQDNPEAKWVNIDEVENLLTFKQDKEFFIKQKEDLKKL